MKHALLVCFFSVFIIGLANCECLAECTAQYNLDKLDASVDDPCTVEQSYIDCLANCQPAMLPYVQHAMDRYRDMCVLPAYSGSTSPSVSFLTFLVAPLFAAYRAFGL